MLLDESSEVLKTSELGGRLDQLGDALQALGLDSKFKEFGDTFKLESPRDSKFLRDLIPDFGGINLPDLLPTASLPDNIEDAVKLTHDLDTKAGRAWVRADVNVDLPGREPLFSLGPFVLYLTDSKLTAFVRAEASKDKEDVALSDHAALRTKIEAVISGQVMVTLQDVRITYSSAEKLDFEIDPARIRIHQSMQFVQDTFGSIFGDDVGGLKFVKEGGVPVGVEHQFALPPMSLMYGTSGVQNLQIANRFSLRAYPDFVLANRFNLSRRELPFLFTIFIIGGTGYLQLDTEYRPFDKRLLVIGEAALGGSGSLAFAFGPVTGGVFTALSVVLRFQRRTGMAISADDGLSVALQLVIAGNVSLWGIVTVYLGIMLSMSYHESGRIDALGQLSVEVRVTRWFKLKYSTQVIYKLRDGRASTEVTSRTTTSGKAADAIEKLKKLDQARKSL